MTHPNADPSGMTRQELKVIAGRIAKASADALYNGPGLVINPEVFDEAAEWIAGRLSPPRPPVSGDVPPVMASKRKAHRVSVQTLSPRVRLEKIAGIIEQVDIRASACDGPVTPTMQEMTQDEMSRIYALAKGKPEGWRP